MGPTQAISLGLTKSFNLTGRAPRSEYWWFTAFSTAFVYAIDTLSRSLDQPKLMYVVLVMIPPMFCVGARRLHDIGFSGWFYAVLMVCVYVPGLYDDPRLKAVAAASALGFLLMCILPSQPGPNKYGPNPHEVTP